MLPGGRRVPDDHCALKILGELTEPLVDRSRVVEESVESVCHECAIGHAGSQGRGDDALVGAKRLQRIFHGRQIDFEGVIGAHGLGAQRLEGVIVWQIGPHLEAMLQTAA